MNRTTTTLALIAILLTSQTLTGQVVISDVGGGTAQTGAVLDVQSTSKGFLPPRVDLDNTNMVAPLSSATAGMIIYNEGGDEPDGLYMWDGSKWTQLNDQNTVSVGDFAHGGIVFWVDNTGRHGMACAKVDQNPAVRWFAGTDSWTMAHGDSPMSGAMNTSIIIANQGRGDGAIYAARVAAELQITEGGKTYGDWYLPSKEELNLMYQNKTAINATAASNGGGAFGTLFYWSSSENTNTFVWMQNFNDGIQQTHLKNETNAVRAVRAF